MATSILLFFAWFLAGFVNGLTGMGAAIVALPIMVCFMPIDSAVAASCIISFAVLCFTAFESRKDCKLPLLRYLLTGVAIGAIPGLLVLKYAPGGIIEMLTGGLLLLYVVWQMRRGSFVPRVDPKPGRAPGDKAAFYAGVFAGFCQTTSSIGAPALAIYGSFAKWDKMTMRANISCIAAMMAGVAVVLQGVGGMWTQGILLAAAWGIPGAFFGFLSSIPLVRAINEKAFQKALLLLIALAGVVLMARATSNGFLWHNPPL